MRTIYMDYEVDVLEVVINKIRTEQASRAPRLEGRVTGIASGNGDK